MSRAIIGQWGRSLALRLPGRVITQAKLQVGDTVEVVVEQGVIQIRRTEPSLDALFEGRTPEEWREEYASAFDWGADRGREAVDG